MGGNGRRLLTAAVGSNDSGPTSVMRRAAAVNTLQGLGARQVKLIADSLESETARTALHAVLAGTGAAAQGQNITSAALGASASVVVNNLVKVAYEQDEQHPLNLAQREACKNLVTTLIAGTTQALGGEAAIASVAATLEAENNSVAVATVPATGSAALTLTIEEIAACLSVTTEEVLAVLAAAGTVGLTAISVIGIAALPGLLYECGIDRQIQREVTAITEGRRDIEQVIAERGLERARLIELSLGEQQLFSRLTPDEQSQIRHLGHECLPLPGIVECRRKFLQAMWAKYHPEAPLTLKTFTPALPHHTGGTLPQLDIPLHTGDPAPEIELPRHTGGNQTPETTAQDPLIFVPADPTLTQMPPGGAPIEVPQFPIVIEKRRAGDEGWQRRTDQFEQPKGTAGVSQQAEKNPDSAKVPSTSNKGTATANAANNPTTLKARDACPLEKANASLPNNPNVSQLGAGGPTLTYAPSTKHGEGGWGTFMDLSDKEAQKILNSSIQGGKQRYGLANGKLYKFQLDNVGGWHGYPIIGTEIPPKILREFLSRGDISKSEYSRFLRGK